MYQSCFHPKSHPSLAASSVESIVSSRWYLIARCASNVYFICFIASSFCLQWSIIEKFIHIYIAFSVSVIFIFTHFGVRRTECNDLLCSFMKHTCVPFMLYFVSFRDTTCTMYSASGVRDNVHNVHQYNFIHIMRKSNWRAKLNNVQTYQFMFNDERWKEDWNKPNQTKSMIKCEKNTLNLNTA